MLYRMVLEYQIDDQGLFFKLLDFFEKEQIRDLSFAKSISLKKYFENGFPPWQFDPCQAFG